LATHDHDIFEANGEAIGVDFDLVGFSSGVKLDRGWLVKNVIAALVRRRRVAGWVVEVLVGHATFCGLALRGTLSCFSSVYRFIQAHYESAAPLWTSVVEELTAFAGLIPMLRSFWICPWNSRVYATDASESGHGMTQGIFEVASVAAVGRIREISRFRLRPGCSARQAVLGGGIDDEAEVDQEGPEAGINLDAWETDPKFPEVPKEWLEDDQWRICGAGKWAFEDNIVRLEGRALLKAIRRLALTRFGTFIRQVILCDNMSVVLSFNRCRAKDFRLLCLIRRFQAYCIARHIRVSVRWVPSELNSADKPSRFFDGQARVSDPVYDGVVKDRFEHTSNGVANLNKYLTRKGKYKGEGCEQRRSDSDPTHEFDVFGEELLGESCESSTAGSKHVSSSPVSLKASVPATSVAKGKTQSDSHLGSILSEAYLHGAALKDSEANELPQAFVVAPVAEPARRRPASSRSIRQQRFDADWRCEGTRPERGVGRKARRESRLFHIGRRTAREIHRQ
jgi:hypothetical protein